MPRFLDRSGRFLVSTNMKVMYSTLAAHQHLREVDEWNFFWGLHSKYKLRPHLFLTRDPCARAISAFKDKFRLQMELVGSKKFCGWQQIHRVYYRHLGLRDEDSDEHKRKIFQLMSFAQFVSLLPHTYMWDGHLRPQYLLERIRLFRLLPVMSARITHLRRMEELNPEEMLQDWGLDVSLRRNETGQLMNFYEFEDSTALNQLRTIYAEDCAYYDC